MKRKERQDLRQRTPAELLVLLAKEEQELVKTRMEKKAGLARNKQKRVAVIKTIIREKELAQK
jgi:ribosomal protein L29